MSKIITNPDPTWFTTQLDEGSLQYPFFGTEDGDLIGLGHQNPSEFAAAAKDYWRETDGGDPEDEGADLADVVVHRWALIREGDSPDGDYAFYVVWYQDDEAHTPVSAETPDAVAITELSF